jgi:hypothetical protein
MRKWLIGMMVVVLAVAFSVGIDAKHNNRFRGDQDYGYGRPVRMQEREDARYIIHRTAETIFSAQQAAERGRHYIGLRRSIAHQQRARRLYMAGAYREAIYHSLRARDIAFQVIAQNQGRPRREYYRDDMENHYVQTAPRNNDLDIRIDSVKVGKEDALVRLHFGLDITQ